MRAAVIRMNPRATQVLFNGQRFTVELADGRARFLVTAPVPCHRGTA